MVLALMVFQMLIFSCVMKLGLSGAIYSVESLTASLSGGLLGRKVAEKCFHDTNRK